MASNVTASWPENCSHILFLHDMSLAWVSDQPASSNTEMQLPPRVPGGVKRLIQIFCYLQALDFLTTLIGLKLGISEASPFIRFLMHYGPSVAVAASKI